MLRLIAARLRTEGLEAQGGCHAPHPPGHLPGSPDAKAPDEAGAVRIPHPGRVDGLPFELRGRHLEGPRAPRGGCRDRRPFGAMRHYDHRHARLDLLPRKPGLVRQDPEFVVVHDQEKGARQARDQLLAREPRHLLARVVNEGQVQLPALPRVARHRFRVVGRNDHERRAHGNRVQREVAGARHGSRVERRDLVLLLVRRNEERCREDVVVQDEAGDVHALDRQPVPVLGRVVARGREKQRPLPEEREAVSDVRSAAAGDPPHGVDEERDGEAGQPVRDEVVHEPPGKPHQIVERHGTGDDDPPGGGAQR